IHGDPTIFLRHVATFLIVGVYSVGGAWLIYKLCDAAITLRVRPEQEAAGLDVSQHAESFLA
ncbi:MAG: ammonia channel protein, partial [Elusimicrobiota bacterium]